MMDCPTLGGEPQDINCHGCVCEECILSTNSLKFGKNTERLWKIVKTDVQGDYPGASDEKILFIIFSRYINEYYGDVEPDGEELGDHDADIERQCAALDRLYDRPNPEDV